MWIYCFAVFTLIGLYSANAFDKDTVKDSYKRGLEEYLKTGEKSEELQQALAVLQLPRLFRRDDESPYGGEKGGLVSWAACVACNGAASVAINARRRGVPKEALVFLLEKLCVWLNIESKKICEGSIRLQVDSILYIIDNKKDLTSERVCSILLQKHECKDPHRRNWTINIPPRKSARNIRKISNSKSKSLKVLHITDIHYDPDYVSGSNAACGEPVCCQSGTTPSQPKNTAGYWGDFRNCDVPWHAFTDYLKHMVTQHADLDFVYFTGDIIDHKVWNTNVTGNIQAITDVLQQLKSSFGSKPVYPILGNHEPHPVNLFALDSVTHSELRTQWIFDLAAKEWQSWLPIETRETILKGGYYSFLAKPGFRIIGLNSNVCYTLNWWLLYNDIDPFGQLQWLVDVLASAELNGEIVHILSHVPTGESDCLHNWGKEYTKIISRYADTIAAQFNGHTHTDDTVIFYDTENLSKAINVAFNGGSLTTYSHLNPNYKIYDVDSTTMEVLDFESWAYNLTEANLTPDLSPNWFKLYSFKDAYGVDSLKPQELSMLTERMAKSRSFTEKYFRFRHREGDKKLAEGCDDDCHTSSLCKMFVAHSNVQQLLASIWYEGLPGFRRKNMVLQALEIVRIGILFPFFSAGYILAPHSVIGKTMRKPFIKFICNSASYFVFLFMLILASQRIETLFFEEEPEDVPTKRGAKPSLVEWIILAWVSGLIWSEIKQLWDVGLEEYARDMWNVIDFITNSLYVATVALRVVSYYQVQKNPKSETIKREDWDAWDPMLISEGLFSAANIFSSLKLVYIFSVNPHLGPLQVSLSRMVMDIMKFFFLYVLVLFAFSCGLNQLLWYYADAERLKCPSESTKPEIPNHSKLSNCTISEPVADSNACTIWRRFANLFETSQTLFWAVFGLVDLESFELSGIKIFTRFWGMLMFGTYSVINIVVLLNLLIAMMNHSYQLISERADVEWKFARSKLWISYFEEGGTVPPPFNIIPTPKSVWYVIEWLRRKLCGHSKAAKKEHMRTIRKKVKQASERDFRYQSIMRNLVRRYVTVEQRKAENQGVTEDDVNEIKQDISAFRFELIEILKNSGMNTSTAQSALGAGAGGKKNRQKERRLMKGFNIGPQPSTTTGPLPPVAEFIASLQQHHQDGQQHDLFGSTLSGIFNSTPRKIHQQSSTVSSSQGSINEGHYHHHSRGKYENWFHTKRASSHKRRWGTLIEAAKTGKVSRLIGRSRSEDSVCNSHCRENGHNHSHSHSNSPASDENGSVSPSDSNPSLDRVPPDPPIRQEEHHHGLASGLLLLKKKRKKFSASRNASPIVVQPHNAVDHVHTSSTGKSNKKVLQRASSVPVRVSEVIQLTKRNLEQTQSEQESVDIPTAAPSTLTPSTTEESVAAATGQSALPTGTSSREPLLYNSSSSTQATGSSQTPEDEYKQNSQYYPKLPGIIPISGHNGRAGWL